MIIVSYSNNIIYIKLIIYILIIKPILLKITKNVFFFFYYKWLLTMKL